MFIINSFIISADYSKEILTNSAKDPFPYGNDMNIGVMLNQLPNH